MDPITAIANAAGSLFDTIGSGLNLFALGGQKKIVKEQTKQQEEITDQTGIAARSSFLTNLFGLVGQKNASESTTASSQQKTVMIIVGATFAVIILIIILKARKK